MRRRGFRSLRIRTGAKHLGSIHALLAQMMKSKDIGPVPIVENEQTQRLLGIATDSQPAVAHSALLLTKALTHQ